MHGYDLKTFRYPGAADTSYLELGRRRRPMRGKSQCAGHIRLCCAIWFEPVINTAASSKLRIKIPAHKKHWPLWTKKRNKDQQAKTWEVKHMPTLWSSQCIIKRINERWWVWYRLLAARYCLEDGTLSTHALHDRWIWARAVSYLHGPYDQRTAQVCPAFHIYFTAKSFLPKWIGSNYGRNNWYAQA